MIRFLKLYERFGIFLFIIVGVVFLSIASPNFLKLDTILNVIAQGTYAAVVGFGMTLAITSGGFDLSVESVMALSSVLLAILIPALRAFGRLEARLHDELGPRTERQVHLRPHEPDAPRGFAIDGHGPIVDGRRLSLAEIDEHALAEQTDDPLDVVGVDVGADQQLERAVALRKRCDLRPQALRIRETGAAVDEHAMAVAARAVLDPQAVAMTGGEHLDG